MAMVKFVTCSLASYTGLEEKDAGTLYFVTDERRIYKGDVPFSGGIYKAVVEYPEGGSAEVNTIYVNTTDGSAKFYNGSDFVVLVKPQPASITGSGLATELATTKAVVDYVAEKIGDLDVSALEGRVAANEAAIEVINGSGEGSITKALQDAKAYTDELKSGQVATNTSEIEALKTGKADKASTLAGYGITDAYTKGEADSKIAQAVADAAHLKREIVEELPEVEGADENTIYMVGTGEGSKDSAYEEYMLINGAFEKIGDSKVDLTNYATKEYVDGKDGETLEAAKQDAAAKISALNAVDEAVEGQYVSAVTETAGVISVTRAELPVKSVTEGSGNGTIAVNGSDVNVHGLGDAAYTNKSDYATAAQGAKADTALQQGDVTEGSANGTIAVKGSDVKVHGLGSAAYADTTAFDSAGAANTALSNAKAYTDAALTWEEL